MKLNRISAVVAAIAAAQFSGSSMELGEHVQLAVDAGDSHLRIWAPDLGSEAATESFIRSIPDDVKAKLGRSVLRRRELESGTVPVDGITPEVQTDLFCSLSTMTIVSERVECEARVEEMYQTCVRGAIFSCYGVGMMECDLYGSLMSCDAERSINMLICQLIEIMGVAMACGLEDNPFAPLFDPSGDPPGM